MYALLISPLKVRSSFQSLTLGNVSSNNGNGNENVNKSLGNSHCDYFVIISSFSHPLLLTDLAATGLVEAPLKQI